jgi:DNA-binding transcriptional MerR regulator
MDRNDQPRFTAAELEDATGVSARNIRYYIQEGLVSPSAGRGKSAYYTAAHVEQLTLARDLRARGLSLEEIREALAPVPEAVEDDRERWHRIKLRDDLEIHMRADAPEAVQELTRQFREQFRNWLGPDPDGTF